MFFSLMRDIVDCLVQVRGGPEGQTMGDKLAGPERHTMGDKLAGPERQTMGDKLAGSPEKAPGRPGPKMVSFII